MSWLKINVFPNAGITNLKLKFKNRFPRVLKTGNKISNKYVGVLEENRPFSHIRE